jgi:hypothetical protein
VAAITGIEEALLKIGHTIAKQLAQKWLAERKARNRRGRDLSDLLDKRFPGRGARREIDRALLGVEDRVAERLAPALARAAYNLPDNERDAALYAVSDALDDADLSDAALFDVNLDPDALATAILRTPPIGLGERATVLYETALRQACIVLAHMVRELPEFSAATAVETLSRLARSLDKLDELLARIPQTDTDVDGQFRRRYLDAVSRHYDQLEVIGLTTHHYEPKTTLSVAYLSLSVAEESRQPTRRDHVGPDWWPDHQGQRRQSDNLRVEAALANNARTVIRGEAGAGKSTLLSWLAVNAARGTFTSQLQGWNECVPFLVKLRDFANRALPRGDALISEQTELECGPIPAEWVHRQLESGSAILLVDGVDELTSSQRDKVRAWLRAQLGQYPDIRVVVTSRPTAITPKWLARENFRSVVLEPMNPTDVQVFLQRWHRALLDSLPDPALLPCDPEDVPKHERSLLAQLQARAHLRALARNPLLCAMLCALNLDRKAKLPRDRLALYSAALDMLLERRDSDRGVAVGVQATPAEKLVLLRALAWWLNENSRTQMTRDQALDRLRDRLPGMPAVHEEAEALLDHLVQRSGVIRQPALGKIDFIHRTFQEFLAAKEAVDRDSIDLLIRNARSDQWRETVLMACAHANAEQRGRLLTGILDAADTANTKVARQLRLVAAACKETATLVEPAEVITRIDAAIRDLLPPRNIRESRSLASVGEAILDNLPASLDHLTSAQAAACFRTAALVNGPQALDVLARYANDQRQKVKSQAEKCWRYFDPESYARRVLANASLRNHINVDFSEAVPRLRLMKNLRGCRVDLSGQGPIDSEVLELATLTNLTHLTLVADTASATWGELSRLKELAHLRLSLREFPPELDFIGTLTHLQNLALLGTDALIDCSFLNTLTELKRISLLDCPIQNWVDKIVNPTRIRVLAYKTTNGDDLARISLMPNLRVLQVFGSEPVDLAPLANRDLEVWLDDGMEAQGIDRLGPGVRLTGPGSKVLKRE